MLKITMNEVKDLIEQAKAASSSGHAFLNQRWADYPQARRPYYRFCQLLARKLKPELVVELGIDEGNCCAHWASSDPAVSVVGVDIHKDGETPSIRCKEVAAVFPNFNYVRAWTWDGLATVKKLNKPINILFIDSWHEYDYMAKDWNDYNQLIVPGSLVLVDDLQMPEIADCFNDLESGEKYVDHTMNPAIPFGIMLYDGKPNILQFKHRDFMPNQ